MKLKLRTTATAVLFAGVLAGCGNMPDKNAPQPENYGAFPADYKALIDAYRLNTLKEPSGTVVQYLNEPATGWTRAALGAPAVFGYRVCLIANEKNSYTGNVGNLLTEVFIRDGKVVSYRAADHSSSAYDAIVQSACDAVSAK